MHSFHFYGARVVLLITALSTVHAAFLQGRATDSSISVSTKRSSPVTSGDLDSIVSSSSDITTTSTTTITPTITLTSGTATATKTKPATRGCALPTIFYSGWCRSHSNVTVQLSKNLKKGIKKVVTNHGVFLPLYKTTVDNSTWQFTNNLVKKHGDVVFTIVVGSASEGPSSLSATQSKHPEFIANLKKLNTYKNTQVLGYVNANATRKKSQVVKDVNMYSSWGEKGKSTKTGLDGVYFDKQTVDTSSAYVDRMANYIDAVKSGNFNNKNLVGVGINGVPSVKQFTSLKANFFIPYNTTASSSSSSASSTTTRQMLFTNNTMSPLQLYNAVPPRIHSKLALPIAYGNKNTTARSEKRDLVNMQMAFNPMMFYFGVVTGREQAINGTLLKAALKQIGKPVMK